MSAPADPIELELILRTSVHARSLSHVLGRLAPVARSASFAPGAHVLRAGERATCLFVIAEGEVEIAGRRHGRGVPIGVLELFAGGEARHDAVAVDAVRCIAISASDYDEMLHDDVDVSLGVIERLASTAHELGAWRRHTPAPRRAALDANELIAWMIAIRASPPFARASAQAFASLARLARPRRLSTGEVLFERDAGRVWLVIDGYVEVSAGHPPAVMTCGPGDPLGLAAAFAPDPGLHGATAVTDAVVLAIDRELLLDRLEEHVTLTRSILAYLGAFVLEAMSYNRSDASLVAPGGTERHGLRRM